MLEKRHCTSLFTMQESIPLYGKKLFKELKRVFDNTIEKYQLTKTSSVWVPQILD